MGREQSETFKMAIRYKRAMAPLDAKARARLWDGGGATAVIAGSESSTGKLEELLHAFYNDEMSIRGDNIEEKEETPGAKWPQALELELKDDLAEPAVKWIRANAEAAVGTAGLECEDVVRRRLVRLMQERGLDAGICKSQWHNSTVGISACSHEYIDAVVGETRYIVEINLAGEFKIARPTEDYTQLLSSLPKIFVGRPSKLEAVIRLMCSAAQESIKKAGMHVPPWRRTKYMHEKWFGDYRRYTDTFSSSDSTGRTTAPTAYTANYQRCRGVTGSSKLVKSIFLRGM